MGPLDPVRRHGRKVFRFVSPATGEPLTPRGVSLTVTGAGKVPARVLQKLTPHANIRVTMTFCATADGAVEAAVPVDAGGEPIGSPSAGAARRCAKRSAGLVVLRA